jgi:hypothetical protein
MFQHDDQAVFLANPLDFLQAFYRIWNGTKNTGSNKGQRTLQPGYIAFL